MTCELCLRSTYARFPRFLVLILDVLARPPFYDFQCRANGVLAPTRIRRSRQSRCTMKANARTMRFAGRLPLKLRICWERPIHHVGVPNGIRTRVLALKGPRPRPLDDGDTEVSYSR